jgi:hypothetical protein
MDYGLLTFPKYKEFLDGISAAPGMIIKRCSYSMKSSILIK